MSLLSFRLIGQLDETETAFEDFWERHRTKLEQCLQLRHFEHHFREVSPSEGKSKHLSGTRTTVYGLCAPQIRAQLDVMFERLSGFSEVSVSPAHAEHVLRELGNHEEKAFVRTNMDHDIIQKKRKREMLANHKVFQI